MIREARRVTAACMVSLGIVSCSAIWGFEDLRRASPATADGGGDGGDGGPSQNPDATGKTKANKVDILLVVDSSAAMASKQAMLTQSLDPLIRAATATNDVHVGVITSALGSPAGDICSNTGRGNDLGRLVSSGAGQQPFLTYAGGDQNVDTFISLSAGSVALAGREGCGLPSTLEAAYRFLSAPDPWVSVSTDGAGKASYAGVDDQVLAQRAAFLRPDSLVVVLIVTDKDDASLDPLSFGGMGWQFGMNVFPGSTSYRRDGKGTTAPRPTSICGALPLDPLCTSCKCVDAACPGLADDPSCRENGGYYGEADEQLNIRFHRMKQRYGVDPQFPLSRYTNALTKVRVPRRSDEHPETGGDGQRRIGPYDVDAASCTNPLFAARLPKSSSEDLCSLPIGPRDKSLVIVGVLGGLPPSLVKDGSPVSWEKVLGRDPERYDLANIDPHMIQSPNPREGLPSPAERGDNGNDPDHGREWVTQADDLQYACTFDLEFPVTCTLQDAACDCAGAKLPPVCGPKPGEQIKGRAHPSVRPLRLARELGARATVGSVCARGTPPRYSSFVAALAGAVSDRLE